MTQQLTLLRDAVAELRQLANRRSLDLNRFRALMRRDGERLAALINATTHAVDTLWPVVRPNAWWDSGTLEHISDALSRYRPVPFTAFDGTGEDPAILVPDFLSTWEDESYVHAACAAAFLPLTRSKTSGLLMWVDFDERSRREFRQRKKFILTFVHGDDEQWLFSTESERHAARAVARLLASWPKKNSTLRAALKSAQRASE
jgi:hypothetical protein